MTNNKINQDTDVNGKFVIIPNERIKVGTDTVAHVSDFNFYPVTIPATAWDAGLATVNVTGVTTTNQVEISYDVSTFEKAANAGIYASAQGSGTLTFKAMLSVPLEDVIILVRVKP